MDRSMEYALGLALQRFILDLVEGNIMITQEQIDKQLTKRYSLEQLMRHIKSEKLKELIQKSEYPNLTAYTLAKLSLLASMTKNVPEGAMLYLNIQLPTEVAEVMQEYLLEILGEPPSPELVRLHSYLEDQLKVAKDMEVETIPVDPMISTIMLRLLAKGE